MFQQVKTSSVRRHFHQSTNRSRILDGLIVFGLISILGACAPKKETVPEVSDEQGSSEIPVMGSDAASPSPSNPSEPNVAETASPPADATPSPTDDGGVTVLSSQPYQPSEGTPSGEVTPDAGFVPSSDPAPVEASSQSLAGSEPAPVQEAGPVRDEYVVKKGDTLMKIAYDLYGDIDKWRELYDWNRGNMHRRSNLKVGQRISYEKPFSSPQASRQGEPYLIKLGDTLGLISADVYGYARKWRKLWENNRDLIKDPNRIFAGFYLYYVISEQEREQAKRVKEARQARAITSEVPMVQEAKAMDTSPMVSAKNPQEARRSPASATPKSVPATAPESNPLVNPAHL